MIRALAAIAAILFLGTAQAEVGLVEVCLAGDQYGTQQSNRCPSRAWLRPSAGDAVLSCGTITDPMACMWGQAEFRYRRWESIPSSELIQTCASDITPGPFTSPDPCGGGSHTDGKPRIPKMEVEALAFPPRTVRVRWNNATERTDGSPLEPGELLNTAVYWSRSSNVDDLEAVPAEQQVIVDYPGESAQVLVPVGVWHFGARHLAKCGNPEDPDCTHFGEFSDVVELDVRHVPVGPGMFELDRQLRVSEGLAYTSVKVDGGQVLVPLTEIPVETACIMDEAIMASAMVDGVLTRGVIMYAVPSEELIWGPDDATNRAFAVAYARCN